MAIPIGKKAILDTQPFCVQTNSKDNRAIADRVRLNAPHDRTVFLYAKKLAEIDQLFKIFCNRWVEIDFPLLLGPKF
jgi:hypothetical protein